DILATAPAPLEGVFLAKVAAHWITTGVPLAMIAPILGLLLGLPSQAWSILVLSLMLGTPALSLIGGFGATLTLGVKRGGLLLSLLVLPLYIPTLIFGARAVNLAVDGQPVATPIAMLTGLTLISAAILPFASAAALRVNLR
ncbi:MAG: heme exporter protein CcmB, partial [Planktomarina sp.]